MFQCDDDNDDQDGGGTFETENAIFNKIFLNRRRLFHLHSWRAHYKQTSFVHSPFHLLNIYIYTCIASIYPKTYQTDNT